MKKNSLVKKLVLVTVGIGILFFGGSYLSQHFVEKQIVAQAKEEQEEQKEQGETEEDIARAIEESRAWFEEMDNMTVKEYYESIGDYGKDIVTRFQEMYGESVAEIKRKDLTKNQRDELEALSYYYYNINNPILTKNEKERGYSLESAISEIMAFSPDENTEAIINKICEDAGINPNGKTSDVTVEIIMEIDNQIFEYGQENNLH